MPLNAEISTKLADAAVKDAIGFWVKKCVEMMGQVRSEQQIKMWLRKKLKNSSPIGIDFIYRIAQQTFEKHKIHGANIQN